MAKPVKNDREFPPYFPTLFHLASVKMTLPLFLNFRGHILTASTDSEREERTILCRMKARKLLGNFSQHLHYKIWEPYHGFQCELLRWRNYHSNILKLKYVECIRIIQWRSEGTIDTVKTAQKLVLDESIDIGTRFELACMYCLQDSVKALWTEMETSGKADEFVEIENSTADFWINWTRGGSRVPWEQGISEYLDPSRIWNVRFSRFFPGLLPKDRRKFLPSLRHTTNDDLRFCLYAMNSQEEKEMITLSAQRLFIVYLHWPLSNLFLEIVEERWDLIDFDVFRSLILVFLLKNEFWIDVLYCRLFLSFWKRSPSHLIESVKEDPELKMNVDALFNAIKETNRNENDKKKRKFSLVE